MATSNPRAGHSSHPHRKVLQGMSGGRAKLIHRARPTLEATRESQRTTLVDDCESGFAAASYESHAAGAKLGGDRE
jgi:hypothetical protein